MDPSVLLAESPKRHCFSEVYQEHAAFVWRSLKRLGVREGDVEDVCQETFIVVHKKLAAFEGTRVRPWLFAICMRVASDYRKRAHIRKEVATDGAEIEIPQPAAQGEALDRARAQALLQALLSSLEEDKRAVFILHDLEGMPMSDIAEAVQCPVQTAYSRLHKAREHVTAAIERWKRRERVSP